MKRHLNRQLLNLNNEQQNLIRTERVIRLPPIIKRTGPFAVKLNEFHLLRDESSLSSIENVFNLQKRAARITRNACYDGRTGSAV